MKEVLNTAINSVSTVLGHTKAWTKMNSPEIMLFAGIGAGIGALITTQRATLKVDSVKKARDEKKEELEGERAVLKGQLDQLNADLEEISENLENIEKKIDVKYEEIESLTLKFKNSICHVAGSCFFFSFTICFIVFNPCFNVILSSNASITPPLCFFIASSA